MRLILRVPTHPGPSLDARDDELFLPLLNEHVRNPTDTTLSPVIPSVERGTWVGGDAQHLRQKVCTTFFTFTFSAPHIVA